MATVGVLGLGKLGLPLALVLAEAGHEVHTWDVHEETRHMVRWKKSHIDEPGVQDMLTGVKLKLTPPALMRRVCPVIFVVVPTPSLPGGAFSTEFVENAICSVGAATGSSWPIVSLVSTISPGSGEKLSQLASRTGVRYVYTPVMIALGSVVHDLRHPDVQIIGYDKNDKQAAIDTTNILRTVTRGSSVSYQAMDYASAEITKLASNTFSTMKITFANLLGRMCTELGGNVDNVTEALEIRRHIGHQLLTAGSGYGGPCFPRDTLAFDAAGGAPLGQVIHKLNREHANGVVALAIGAAVKSGNDMQTFTVLGREYKEGSNLRIESFGDAVYDRLKDNYCLTPAASRDADIVVIALPLRNFRLCEHLKPGAVVIDLWRTHPELTECDVVYVPFGVATDEHGSHS